MCSLYNNTSSQVAMRRHFQIARDLARTFPPVPTVYPDTMAPVVRTARDGKRELTMMRCNHELQESRSHTNRPRI